MAIEPKIRAKRKPANCLHRLRCRAGNLRISFFEKPRTRKIRVIGMTRAFFIVGPTATGKSEIAADVALEVDGEIVSADAFQIYRGLDLRSRSLQRLRKRRIT